jgi:hypothetical protein
MPAGSFRVGAFGIEVVCPQWLRASVIAWVVRRARG